MLENFSSNPQSNVKSSLYTGHSVLCSATVCFFVSYTFASRHIAVNDDFPPVTTGKKKLKARVVAIEDKKGLDRREPMLLSMDQKKGAKN